MLRDTKFFLYSRMLRYEGIASVWRRSADRCKEARRRRSFQMVDRQSLSGFASPRAPVLNYLGTPPSGRFGGTPLQLIARLAEEALRRPVALLYPDGNRYRLEIECGELRRAVEFPRAQMLNSLSMEPDFEQVISEVARALQVSAIHFEGAAGLPLESVAKLRERGLRFVVSLHDFALFCARPNLFEVPVQRFCNYCREMARCERCLNASWPVKAGAQRSYRSASRRILRDADAVIYPSEFIRQQYRELFPDVEIPKQSVIEPAMNFARPLELVPSTKVTPKHFAFVGAMTLSKGASIFAEVVARLAAPGTFRWSAFGGGDIAILAQLRGSGVTTHGYYRPGTLPTLLRDHAVDVALLLSIVPESFGLALSECWMAGIPAIAFDHGAIAERIREHGGGALVKLEDGSRGVSNLLEAIASGSARIPALEERVSIQTPQNVAFAHLQFYDELGFFEKPPAKPPPT